MIRPPTMAPGIEVKPPRISTGSALSATKVSANCTPLRAPHSRPATSATKPATAHTMRPDVLQRNADRQRRLVIVGHRAQRAADAVLREADRQRRDQQRRRCRRRTGRTARLTMLQCSSSDSIGTSSMPRSSRAPAAPHSSCARPSMKKVRPMVAMNSVICGWLTSGRSTMRSIASAEHHHHHQRDGDREPQRQRRSRVRRCRRRSARRRTPSRPARS